jgi:hypothetical protein
VLPVASVEPAEVAPAVPATDGTGVAGTPAIPPTAGVGAHEEALTPPTAPAPEREFVPLAAPGTVSGPRPFSDPERLTVAELRQLQAMKAPVVVLDVRTDRTLDNSDLQARGAVRLHPDYAVEEARRLGLPKEAWLVAFCA